MTETGGIDLKIQQEVPFPLKANLKCMSGQLVALVGPSGSGKTTLLRSIAGLHKPDHGTIGINQKTWFDSDQRIMLSPQLRKVGFLFQDFALFPHCTALENIMLSIQDGSRTQRTMKAKVLLKQVNLQGLESRYPNQLSGGQKQRVALARALARDPDVLLLDEPFSSVDQSTRKKLLRELSQLRQRLNMPIIMVTHDLDEARVTADELCIIHHGQTLQQAATDMILSRPANALVARLVGLSNLFSGTIKEHKEQQQITLITWQDRELEASFHPEFGIGESIDWVVPAENIILHRADKPSRGERENPINAIIQETIPMGENTYLTACLKEDPDHAFSLSIATHVARRNQLIHGSEIKFSLLANAIHLMPQQAAAHHHD